MRRPEESRAVDLQAARHVQAESEVVLKPGRVGPHGGSKFEELGDASRNYTTPEVLELWRQSRSGE